MSPNCFKEDLAMVFRFWWCQCTFITANNVVRKGNVFSLVCPLGCSYVTTGDLFKLIHLGTPALPQTCLTCSLGTPHLLKLAPYVAHNTSYSACKQAIGLRLTGLLAIKQFAFPKQELVSSSQEVWNSEVQYSKVVGGIQTNICFQKVPG